MGLGTTHPVCWEPAPAQSCSSKGTGCRPPLMRGVSWEPREEGGLPGPRTPSELFRPRGAGLVGLLLRDRHRGAFCHRCTAISSQQVSRCLGTKTPARLGQNGDPNVDPGRLAPASGALAPPHAPHPPQRHRLSYKAPGSDLERYSDRQGYTDRGRQRGPLGEEPQIDRGERRRVLMGSMSRTRPGSTSSRGESSAPAGPQRAEMAAQPQGTGPAVQSRGSRHRLQPRPHAPGGGAPAGPPRS